MWAFPPSGWGISREASPPSLCSSFVHYSHLSTPASATTLLCICCQLSLSCPFFTTILLLRSVPKGTSSPTQLTVLIDLTPCVASHLPKHPCLGKHLSTTFSTTIQYIIMGPGMNSSKLLPYVKCAAWKSFCLPSWQILGVPYEGKYWFR